MLRKRAKRNASRAADQRHRNKDSFKKPRREPVASDKIAKKLIKEALARLDLAQKKEMLQQLGQERKRRKRQKKAQTTR